MEKNEVIIRCSECKKIFKQKKNLYKHLRLFHNIEPLTKKESTYNCEFCKKNFSTKSNLSKHVNKFHNFIFDHQYLSKESIRKTRLLCPHQHCDEKYITYRELRAHLQNDHKLEIDSEELTFDSIKDFEQWKSEMEQQTVACYTLDTGKKKLINGNYKRFYNCHRSYYYRNKCKTMKSMGSNKINKACPSRLEVKIYEVKGITKLEVKFWKTHYGHGAQIRRILLDKNTRKQIAGKLKHGVSIECILDSIRDNHISDNFERINLSECEILHNIVRDFNIDYATKRHQNDAISIKLWVTEMQNLRDECPVLYYKGQNEVDSYLKQEDFALILMTNFQARQIEKFGHNEICIDGTHSTNSYDIQLFTLMIVDEFNQVCPVAFCFSNRSDEEIFQLFFDKIKLKVGVVKPKVFMTDDYPTFYNAWSCIMGEVPNRLLCSWYVDENWRINLNEIKGGIEKQALVYKSLRVLLELTSIDEFNSTLEQVLENWLMDEDTNSFGQYFKNNYVDRPECWAYCYRTEFGINTNMYLEAFHNILKHICLEGKKANRLDNSINAVMKLARDSFLKRLIKLPNYSTDKNQDILCSHKASHLINLEDVEVIEDQKSCIVSSKSNVHQKYLVTWIQETCDSPCRKCSYCNICIHTFKCSCTDNVIKMNICKHIHFCSQKFDTSTDSSHINNNEDPIDLFHRKQITSDKQFIKNEQINQKIELIRSLSDKVPIIGEDADSIDKKLDKIIEIYNRNNQMNLESAEEVCVQKTN